MIHSNRPIGRQLRYAWRLAGLGATAIVLAGCVTAATPSPLANPTTAPARSDAGAAATASPTAEPTATPAPTATAAQNWTGIVWSTPAPIGFGAHPAATSMPDGSGIYADFDVDGWSGGYLAFRSISQLGKDGETLSTQIVPASSTDGINWTESAPLDVSGLDKDEHLGSVYEGPAGLLLVGYPPAATCGGPTPIDGMWLSSDGTAWHRVTSPKFYSMAGGSAGYVATDMASKVWTSTDAVNWHLVDLAKSQKGIVVQDAAAFSGGFVVAGGAPVPDSEGCGESQLHTPALWWSQDGAAWTRDQLTQAPVGPDSWSSVERITNGALIAIGETYDQKTDETKYQAWTSTDGRTWTPYNDARVGNGRVFSDGKTGLLAATPDDKGFVKMFTFGPDFSLVELPQSGTLPTEALANGSLMVLGPKGILVASAEGGLWLGTPTKG